MYACVQAMTTVESALHNSNGIFDPLTPTLRQLWSWTRI